MLTSLHTSELSDAQLALMRPLHQRGSKVTRKQQQQDSVRRWVLDQEYAKHTPTHARTRTHALSFTLTHTCARKRVYTHTNTYKYTHIHTNTHTHSRTHAHKHTHREQAGLAAVGEGAQSKRPRLHREEEAEVEVKELGLSTSEGSDSEEDAVPVSGPMKQLNACLDALSSFTREGGRTHQAVRATHCLGLMRAASKGGWCDDVRREGVEGRSDLGLSEQL